MTSRRAVLGPVSAVLGLLLAAAAAKSTPQGTVEAKRKPQLLRGITTLPTGPAWEGLQYLANDKKGRVFLLDPQHLEVRELAADAGPGPPRGLVENQAPPAYGDPRGAALSPDGGRWVVLQGTQVVAITGQKVEILAAAPFYPHAVAMAGGDPVVLVTADGMERSPRGGPPAEPPLALRWTGKAWETLATDDELTAEEREGSLRRYQSRSVVGLGDSRGRLWVANRYRYRLREYSAAGRLLTEVTVGEGAVRRAGAERVAALQQQLVDDLAKEGLSKQELAKAKIQVNDAELALTGLAEGRDGRLYLLGRAEEGEARLSLDRLDPVALTLERVLVDLPWSEGGRLAAGKDGLYLAATSAARGERAFVSWESLEAAAWQSVLDAHIGGSEAP